MGFEFNEGESATVTVSLKALRLEAIIGIYPQERLQAQALELSLALSLKASDYWRCATLGELNHSLNYASVMTLVTFLAQEGRFRLLESLTATLARALLAVPGPHEERAELLALTIEASKPEVFADAATPSVKLALSQAQLPPQPKASASTTLLRGWQTSSLERGVSVEVSSSPKRLSVGPAQAELLCELPEVTVARLTSLPHELSTLKLLDDSALLLISGKWFGAPHGAREGAAPQRLPLEELISAERYRELWCVEGGVAFALHRTAQ